MMMMVLMNPFGLAGGYVIPTHVQESSDQVYRLIYLINFESYLFFNL